MTLFEPIFLLLALVALITLTLAGVSGLRGQRVRAARLLQRLAIGAGIYLGAVAAASLLMPRQVYEIGDAQCFDDWCIAVEQVQRAPSASGVRYDVSLRLSNRARRVPMGERGTVVYLTDSRQRRFDPLPGGCVPFATQLAPGESVLASRQFDVPADAAEVGLIYTHEGGFPIGWFIVGEGGWFGQPPIVRLQ